MPRFFYFSIFDCFVCLFKLPRSLFGQREQSVDKRKAVGFGYALLAHIPARFGSTNNNISNPFYI